MSSSHTPPSQMIKKVDTIKKNRFFHAIDQRRGKFIKIVCLNEKISYGSRAKWLRQRKIMRLSVAFRRLNKHPSDRSKKMNTKQLNRMLNLQKNPVRDQSWLVQINHFQFDCTRRIMPNACKRRTVKTDRYKMAKMKTIKNKNKRLKIEYELRHENKTIHFFWQYVYYTNETHFDSTECFSQHVLRAEKNRYEFENMQFMLDKKNVKLHFAVSVSWHHKSALQFYNEKHNSSFVIIKKFFKSRKSRYESKKTHRQRIVEWKASLPHDSKIKTKDNLMTQIYYMKRLLPLYAKKINDARLIHNKTSILQKNNDNNHETRSKDNIVKRYKEVNWIFTLIHSPQSPDLNSIETVWNILKQRIKQRRWRTIAELKKMMLNKWNKILLNEIRSRITEIFNRCKKLIVTNDMSPKSALW